MLKASIHVKPDVAETASCLLLIRVRAGRRSKRRVFADCGTLALAGSLRTYR